MGSEDLPDSDGLVTWFVEMTHYLKVRCEPGADVKGIVRNFGYYRAPQDMQGLSQAYGRIEVNTTGIRASKIMNFDEMIQDGKNERWANKNASAACEETKEQ